MQGNFKYPRIKKIHQILEKITRFYQKAIILCVLQSHELLSTKIYYTSIYIFYLLFTSRQVQNSRIIKIHQVHQKLQAEQFHVFCLTCFLFVIHLNSK